MFVFHSGVTFQSVLDKLTQFTKLCHTTGHDVVGRERYLGIYADHRQGTRGGRGGDIAALDIMRDGEFLLIIVRAIRMMSCFVCSQEIWRTHAMGRRTFRIRRPYNSDSPSLSREHLLKNYRKLSA